jgi:hypothetical protein
LLACVFVWRFMIHLINLHCSNQRSVSGEQFSTLGYLVGPRRRFAAVICTALTTRHITPCSAESSTIYVVVLVFSLSWMNLIMWFIALVHIYFLLFIMWFKALVHIYFLLFPAVMQMFAASINLTTILNHRRHKGKIYRNR